MARIVSAVAGQLIHLGRAGENLATTILFDVSDWLAEASQVYPGEDGYFSLYVQQTGVGYYEQLISQPGDEAEGKVFWHITKSNTAITGVGKCELVYRVLSTDLKPILTGTLDINPGGNNFYVPGIGTVLFYGEITELADSNYIYQDELSQKCFYISGNTFLEVHMSDPSSVKHLYEDITVKSVIYDIIVTKSLDQVGDVPSPIQTWLDEVHQMTAIIANAEESIYESERWARGKIHDVPVEPGEDGYEDNSKYYSEKSESWAKGTKNGEEVGSDDPAYNHNSLYYSEQAAASATLANNWVNNGASGTPSTTNNALYYSNLSNLWANNGDNSLPTPSATNNAKYYAQQAVDAKEYIMGSSASAHTEEPTGANPTPSATVSIIEGQNGLIFEFGVPRGVPGTGLVITGTVATVSGLPSASETDVGVAYGVGSGTSYNIYICTYTNSSGSGKTWTNFGTLSSITATMNVWSVGE